LRLKKEDIANLCYEKQDNIKAGKVQLVARLTRNRSILSLSLNKLYPHCLVLVGSKNVFKRNLHKQKLRIL